MDALSASRKDGGGVVGLHGEARPTTVFLLYTPPWSPSPGGCHLSHATAQALSGDTTEALVKQAWCTQQPGGPWGSRL